MMAIERRHRYAAALTGPILSIALSLALAGVGEAHASPNKTTTKTAAKATGKTASKTAGKNSAKSAGKPASSAKARARPAARARTPVAAPAHTTEAPAHAGALLSSRVGVVDASSPGSARVALASGDAAPGGELHYLPLYPAAKAPECCVRPQAAVPARDVSILRFDGDDSQLAAEHAAQFTQAPDGPFTGLAVQGKAMVTRASDQRLFLQWPDRKVSVRVDHCVSAEGVHVRIADSAGPGRWQPAAYYYLPLSKPAAPDCPLGDVY